MTARPAAIQTERLLLVTLLAEELEALSARDVECAGRLAGVTFPPGWPEEREARDGLPWHLRHLRADVSHTSWRIRGGADRSATLIDTAWVRKTPELRRSSVTRRRRRVTLRVCGATATNRALGRPLSPSVRPRSRRE